MAKTKTALLRNVSFLLLLGIFSLGVFGLYTAIVNVDKPIASEPEIDMNCYEVDGKKFFVKQDGIYDENGLKVVGVVEDDEQSTVPQQGGVSLNEIFGIEEERDDEFDFFISKKELQRLYILSLLNSMCSGQEIEVSRWVTSGDWSHDNDDMTITIP